MKFVVRYWSSLLPDYRKPDGEPHWVDHSIHPPTKLGLHNALLTLKDRSQILEQHDCLYECAVFYLQAGKEQLLTQETAERLFVSLPHGELEWPDIRHFLQSPSIGANAVASDGADAQQLNLFEHPHTHTPYDETVAEHHEIETDA
jgi:hypothetical protein